MSSDLVSPQGDERSGSLIPAPRTLHGCEVDEYGGDISPMRCGRPATTWTAPTGRKFFICPDHQDQFEKHGVPDPEDI